MITDIALIAIFTLATVFGIWCVCNVIMLIAWRRYGKQEPEGME